MLCIIAVYHPSNFLAQCGLIKSTFSKRLFRSVPPSDVALCAMFHSSVKEKDEKRANDYRNTTAFICSLFCFPVITLQLHNVTFLFRHFLWFQFPITGCCHGDCTELLQAPSPSIPYLDKLPGRHLPALPVRRLFVRSIASTPKRNRTFLCSSVFPWQALPNPNYSRPSKHHKTDSRTYLNWILITVLQLQ